MSNKEILVAVALILIISGCSTRQVRQGFFSCKGIVRQTECIAVPLASEGGDAQAKQFIMPTNGKTRIYLGRPYTHMPTSTTRVSLDGRLVTELAPLTYVVFEVEPSTIAVSVETENVSTQLNLEVKDGSLYYIESDLSQLFGTYTANMKLVPATSAQPKILRLKRVFSLL